MKRLNKYLVTSLLITAVLMTGCGRRNQEEQPTPTPTPQVGESGDIDVRVTIDGDVPSLINRYLEAQVVELVNGRITPDAPIAGTGSREEIEHTLGLMNEWTVSVPITVEPQKQYGLRVGIFDTPEKGTLLLTADCTNEQACKYFPDGTVKVYQLQMIPATDKQTIYDKGVPEEMRAKCAINPDETKKCGITQTMQYYDEVKDTCYGAPWASCDETKTFKNPGECLQVCRKTW